MFDGDIPPEYIYYKVPNPWMQVKLLRLLQYYPPPGELLLLPYGRELIETDNDKIIDMLHDILQAIIDSCQETPRVRNQEVLFVTAANTPERPTQ